MVLCRYHRFNSLTVGKCKYTDFRTCQEFFDYYTTSALSELSVVNHFVNSLLSLLKVLCYDNTLAKCKSVGFYNCRKRVLRFDIINRRRTVCEHFIICGRNIVLLHKFLWKSLTSLYYSGICTRSECTNTLFFHCVNHTKYKRIVRCNHNKINRIVLCKLNHIFNIRCGDVNTLRKFRNTAVTRCTINFIYLWRLCYFPNNSMLTSAAAYY